MHALVINGIFEVLNAFAVSPGKAVHLKEPMDRALEVLHGLVDRKDFYAEILTKDFLSRLEGLLPLGLALEVGGPMALASHPIRAPYDPSSNCSLLALLQRARNLIEPAPQSGEAPPWSSYVGFVKTICDHFRRLADDPTVASSALMYSLNVSVRQILFLLLNECRRARDVNSSSLDKLEEKAGGLIWFYGWAAYNAKAMDHQRTREASKYLGCVGLSYLDSGFDEPGLTAARNITSLAEHGEQKLKGVSIHELASLLLPLRWVKLLAREMDQTVTLERLEETEQRVIKKLSALNDLKATLDELERQRWSELNQPHGHLLLDPYQPEVVLLRILGRRQQTVSD